jgi:hypothetical protein
MNRWLIVVAAMASFLGLSVACWAGSEVASGQANDGKVKVRLAVVSDTPSASLIAGHTYEVAITVTNLTKKGIDLADLSVASRADKPVVVEIKPKGAVPVSVASGKSITGHFLVTIRSDAANRSTTLIGRVGVRAGGRKITRSEVQVRVNVTPAASALAADSTDDDIREAVFRHQMGLRKNAPNRMYFLSVASVASRVAHSYPDPTSSLMQRFKKDRGHVRKASDADYSSGRRVVDKVFGDPGVILQVGEIKWISSVRVEVEASEYYEFLAASGDLYELELQKGRWVVTDVKPKWES